MISMKFYESLKQADKAIKEAQEACEKAVQTIQDIKNQMQLDDYMKRFDDLIANLKEGNLDHVEK